MTDDKKYEYVKQCVECGTNYEETVLICPNCGGTMAWYWIKLESIPFEEDSLEDCDLSISFSISGYYG